ncbi:MAG: H-type lectin domain-containing protein [Enterobacter sp.]|uniref:H-type lectin domain-containing protein n=1 Tax=Enterobacter TaxID=547 RepID=UPI0021C5F59B|nr:MULTISPECIES: H-type lectin domain-containing protein [Enterobacter]MCU4026034.1 H-type lectin domain-containing protein [Enterobacter roggenkampii]MDU6057541.1 H-type lectin domain-containing protein [Enterobacter sp.]
MLRIGQVEATATQDGKYTDGSVAGGIAATRLRAAAFNAMQEELAHIVESAGLALDINDMTQVLKAIQKLTLSRINPFADIKSDGAAAISTALANLGFRERLLEASGYFELPGGLLLQWGNGYVHATNATVQFKKPFNVTPFIVLPHKISSDNRYVTSVNYTLTGFSLYGWGGSGTANNIDSYTYFALGI